MKLEIRLTQALDEPVLQRTSNGALLIGRRPDVGPKAFTHVLFAGLPYKLVEEAMASSRVLIHPTYAQYLTEYNGAILFQGELSLYGVRAKLSRDADNRQPFDVVGLNNPGERPDWSFSDGTVVGGYRSDGSVLYMTSGSDSISRRIFDSGELLGTWSTFGLFLEHEVERLISLHDRGGKGLRYGDS